MANREYSLRNKIMSNGGSPPVSSVIKSLIDFVDYKSRDSNVIPKIRLVREKSIRYPEFSLDILVDGSDTEFNRSNIDKTLDSPSNNRFLKNAVSLAEPDMRNQTLIVINLGSETYKTLFSLYDEDTTKYSTRVTIYDETSLVLPDDDYDLWYKIKLGVSAGSLGEIIRSEMNTRSNSYMYELRDERDKTSDERLETIRI